MIRGVTNLFWAVFLADGLVSFVDEAFFGGLSDSPLHVFRIIFALAVLLLSVVAVVGVVVTPRAPMRVLVPLILFSWWAGLTQGFPLGYWKVPQVLVWLSVGQIALAVLVFIFFRGHEGRLPFVAMRRPVFQWKHFLLGVPVALGVALVFFVLTLFSGLSAQLETLSGGYVKLRPDGIYLLERRFQSGDREVRLAGMMHVADEEFYTDLLPEDDPKLPSVVLIEGVTDKDNRLGEQELSYSRLASMLKISSQEDSAFMRRVTAGLRRYRGGDSEEGAEGKSFSRERGGGERAGAMDFVHADVDVNTFHPQTIAFIVTVMGIFEAEDFPTLVKNFSESSPALNDESSQQLVIQDVLHSRNEHLVSEIQSSLKDYRRVIIPWGALHLTGIESWLRTRHFVQSGETERKALAFW